MAKRCAACGTVYMDTEAHSCEKERASREKEAGRAGWTDGSFAGGIALGVFLGLFGVLVGHLTKQRVTREGALYGFGARLVLVFLWIAISIALDR